VAPLIRGPLVIRQTERFIDRRRSRRQDHAVPRRQRMANGGFGRFFARLTACHMVTYFVVGALAYFAFDYATAFRSEHFACWMRPTTSKWVAVGPALQWIRGLVFAAALFPFRHVFLETGRGWLKLWGLLLGLAILGTAGPAPGSIEGLIYTTIPPLDQIIGLREVVVQTLLFSYLLVAWYRHPRRTWDVALYGLTGLVVLMSLAGVLATGAGAPR
jgi:hypothetical protein